jgi:hypothetical protein
LDQLRRSIRCHGVVEAGKLHPVIDDRRFRGSRLFCRWRSRSGRPSVDRDIRRLIQQMNAANPLWGAPRIHGELPKIGIEISRASVAKYLV